MRAVRQSFEYLDLTGALREKVREGLSFEQFHDEEVGAVFRADVVECADVRMRQLRDRFGFTFQPRFEIRVVRQVRGENLDRDLSPQSGVLRPVDLAHPSGPDGTDDFVGTEASAGFELHCGEE